jgi:hypothetical protein
MWIGGTVIKIYNFMLMSYKRFSLVECMCVRLTQTLCGRSSMLCVNADPLRSQFVQNVFNADPLRSQLVHIIFHADPLRS